jgi:hypothetical protein
MEREFFEIEGFRDRADLLARVSSYNLFFNLARKNSGKENKTPWELVLAKRPTAGPLLPLLAPVFLDELLFNQLHNSSPRGYDVWGVSQIFTEKGWSRRGTSGTITISGVPGVWTDGRRRSCTAWWNERRTDCRLCGRRGEIESRQAAGAAALGVISRMAVLAALRKLLMPASGK